jgi:hypothetical protein
MREWLNLGKAGLLHAVFASLEEKELDQYHVCITTALPEISDIVITALLDLEPIFATIEESGEGCLVGLDEDVEVLSFATTAKGGGREAAKEGVMEIVGT